MAKRKKKKESISTELVVAILIIISILLAVLIFTKSGYIGENLSPMLGGLVGFMKYIIPVGTFAMAISIAYKNGEYMNKKLLQYTGFILCICVIFCIIQIFNGNLNENSEFWDFVGQAYDLGEENHGGGAVGAIIALPLIKLLGEIGAIIFNSAIAIVLLAFMLGIKPTEIVVGISESLKEKVKQKKIWNFVLFYFY